MLQNQGGNLKVVITPNGALYLEGGAEVDLIDRMVSKLQEKGVEDTPYEDKNW